MLIVTILLRGLLPFTNYKYVQHLWNASEEYSSAGIWWDGLMQPENTPLVPSVEVFGESDLTDGIACFRIPSVVSTGTHLYAFVEARQATCEDGGNSRIAMKRSLDDGLSWSEMYYLTQSGLRAKNPTVLYDSEKKKIVLHYTLAETPDDGQGQCCRGASTKQAISYNGNIWSIEDITHFLQPYTGILPGPGNAFYNPRTQRYLFTAHYGSAYQANGVVIVYTSDDHGLTYTQSATTQPHMDEATIAQWNTTHLVLNMRNKPIDALNVSCSYRAMAFSEDDGTTWSQLQYVDRMRDPVCQGSSTSYQQFTFFVHPNMCNSRANLTLMYKSIHSTKWETRRITNEFSFSDYSSIVQYPKTDDGHLYVGVLWGSCSFPLPFRVWCAFDNAWTVRFGWIRMM